jgi:sec-independent protein translocase protein TatA
VIRPSRDAEGTRMPNIGPMELIVVLVIALVILGPKRLPSAARSAGKGLREFKDSVAGITGRDDDHDEQPRERTPAEIERTTA